MPPIPEGSLECISHLCSPSLVKILLELDQHFILCLALRPPSNRNRTSFRLYFLSNIIHRSIPMSHQMITWDYSEQQGQLSLHIRLQVQNQYEMGASSDQCKYLQICQDIDGIKVRLKGDLFDANSFWMIQSIGRNIIDFVQCNWLQSGSKEVLMDILLFW